MRTTIDKAGRLVIPAAVREKTGFAPGAELEVTVEDFEVRLRLAVSGPTIERVGGRLVARPSVPPDQRSTVDIKALIEEERNRQP